MIARTVFRDVVISYVVHHLYLRIPRGGVPVDVVVSDDKGHLSND